MRGIEAKVVVLGSGGVGKTCLVTKYIKNTSHTDPGPTIGASFFTCRVLLENVKIKLDIWDTAGQERFKALGPLFYRNASAAILVFDLSQYRTFNEIKVWIQNLHRVVQEPLILTLVGNKLDLCEQRAVSYDEAYVFATSIGATYLEASAEEDQGLDQVFLATAMGLVRLANEGKALSLRQFNSSDSISTYTNAASTVFAYSRAINANATDIVTDTDTVSATNATLNGRFSHYEPSNAVRIGLPVEDDVKTNAVGRLETPSWSIEHIAFGEKASLRWCCF